MRSVKFIVLGFTLCYLSIFNFVEAEELNRVAVVVNKYLKGEIEKNLNIYLEDLRNEGYEPILREWDLENNPKPEALRTEKAEGSGNISPEEYLKSKNAKVLTGEEGKSEL